MFQNLAFHYIIETRPEELEQFTPFTPFVQFPRPMGLDYRYLRLNFLFFQEANAFKPITYALTNARELPRGS